MAVPIRVLVVDDSAFARKVLREVLQSDDVEVVGLARDGLEALEQVADLRPDVITLDLMMPNLDGIGVLNALPKHDPPRVVIVSISGEESVLGVEALQAGAIMIVQKPTALATEQLYELKGALLDAVRVAALARPSMLPASTSTIPVPRPKHCDLVVVGTSTGGPQALTRLLSSLPAEFPVPLAIALHIPPGYTDELAKRLDHASALHVVEASDGLVLRPGMAVLARGGAHLELVRSGELLRARLDDAPRGEPHAPSVDVLFESAAAAAGARVLGVVLTGMGSDGLRGAHAIQRAGGRLIVEAETSCVVYGMPRVVKEAGLAVAEARLEAIATAIAEHL